MTHHVLSFDFDCCLWNKVVRDYHIPQAIEYYLTSNGFTENQARNLNLESASKLICDTHNGHTERDKTTKITLLKGLRKAVLDSFVKSSQDLISRIQIDNVPHDKVTLMVGSARQDILVDADCQSHHRPSCFPFFVKLAEHGGYSLDRWLTGDIYASDKITPREFDVALKLENEAGKKLSEQTAILKYPKPTILEHRHEVESKITILYAQMHRQSQLNPNKDIVFHFVDDRIDILDALRDAFSDNPSLIPQNVTLVLHQYGTPFNESDQSLAAEYKKYTEIKGRGLPDPQYADTVLETLQSYPTDLPILTRELYRLTSRLFASRYKKGSSIEDTLTSDTDSEAKEEEKTSEVTFEKFWTDIYSPEATTETGGETKTDIYSHGATTETGGETKSAVPHTHPMDDQTVHMIEAFYHYAQTLCGKPRTAALGKALENDLKYFLSNKLSGIDTASTIHFTLDDDTVKLLLEEDTEGNPILRLIETILKNEITADISYKDKLKTEILNTIILDANSPVGVLVKKILNDDIVVDNNYKQQIKTTLLDNSLTHYEFIESIYESKPSEHRDLMQRATEMAHLGCRRAITAKRPENEKNLKDGVTAASGIIEDASASMKSKKTAGRFCVELHRHVNNPTQGFSEKTIDEVNAGATQPKIWRRVRGAMLCVAATALVGLMVYTTLASGGIFAPISITAIKITGGTSVGLAKGATSLIGLASGLFGTQRLVQHRSKHERMSYLAY